MTHHTLIANMGKVALAFVVLVHGTIASAIGPTMVQTTSKHWQRLWPTGREFKVSSGYRLTGEFVPDVEASTAHAAYWKRIVGGWIEGTSFFVGMQGVQLIETESCWNTDREGFFWTQSYHPATALTMTSKVAIPQNLLSNELLYYVDPDAKESYEEFRKKHWGITSIFSLHMGKLRKKAAERSKARHIRLAEEYGADVSLDETTYLVDTTTPEFRNTVRKLAPGTVNLAENLMGLGYSLGNEFVDRTTLLWSCESARRNDLTEGPSRLVLTPEYGGYSDEEFKKEEKLKREQGQSDTEIKRWRESIRKRKRQYNDIMLEIDALWSELEEEGAGSDAAAFWKKIADEDPRIWAKKSAYQGDSAGSIYYEMHADMEPYFAVWGSGAKAGMRNVAFFPEDRQEGSIWLFDAAIFNAYLSKDFSRYKMTGSFVVQRMKDATLRELDTLFPSETVTDGIRGFGPDEPCYVLKLLSSGPIDGETRVTTAKLEPREKSANLFTLEITPQDNPEKTSYLFVSKESGLLAYGRISSDAVVSEEKRKIDIRELKGLYLTPGSKISLKIEVKAEKLAHKINPQNLFDETFED